MWIEAVDVEIKILIIVGISFQPFFRGTENLELKSFHLESILDMPLKLGVLKHIVFGDKVDVFEFDTVFNLFEYIGGIIWELSFQGAPKECAI